MSNNDPTNPMAPGNEDFWSDSRQAREEAQQKAAEKKAEQEKQEQKNEK